MGGEQLALSPRGRNIPEATVKRFWFYRPEWYFPTWKPIWLGGDEYYRRTIVIGYNVTGQLVIAVGRPDALDPFRDDDGG